MLLLENFILQLLFSVGIVVLFGIIINSLNKLFFSTLGRASRKACIITGFIGTPIHELSHATMCVLFGHKIIKMQLFPTKENGNTLGFINHSYNKKNLYHLIGNFFIGVAPIIFGSLAIYVLMYFLAPLSFSAFKNSFLEFNTENTLLSLQAYKEIGKAFWQSIKSLVLIENLKTFSWWIFIILSASIALHLSVSPADIKSGKTGFFFTALFLFIVDLCLYLVNEVALIKTTAFILRYGVFIINFLTVSIILTLALILIAFILRPILRSRA